MLSNPPSSSNLHMRQRQHRRQNSTPTALGAVKIAPLPNLRQQQQQQQQQQQERQRQRPSQMSHRRGMTLDTGRLHMQLQHQQQPTSSPTRQDFNTVSTTTTRPGLSTTPQHVLRETQQQRILARPGPSQLNNHSIINQDNTPRHMLAAHSRNNSVSSVSTTSSIRTKGHSRNSSINHFGMDENSFLLSPHGTPQSQRFMDPTSSQGQFDGMSIPFDPYTNAMNLMMKKTQASYEAQDFELYAPNSTLSTPTFVTFAEADQVAQQGWISEGETTSSRRTARRISNGIMDRVAKFEHIAQSTSLESLSRPNTPPGENATSYFPPTPADTPHGRMAKHPQAQARPSRFAEDYDESMEETLKPARGRRANNNGPNVFADMRQQAEAMERSQSSQSLQAMPLPFPEGPMLAPDFLNLVNMEGNAYNKVKLEFDNLPSGGLHISPSRSQGSSPMSMHPNMAGFSMMNAVNHTIEQPYNEFSSQDQFYNDASAHSSRYSSPTFGPNSHRRTESIASAVSAASIASINIEETKTDTGVTMEEIAQYITGPDPSNGKWTCTYESCGKTFGRKENIKSHVQTHLNDRQYQCPSCKKCFVRQHDLKRHAKIHTGIKPYPCECGNSFARHDALTRHRQRGMCIGAFDGIVRKVVKRGRPRKVRPDMEERLEKSERTRRKNKEASVKDERYSPNSNGSQSGYETSSAANSPSNDFDGVLDDAPFTDIEMLDVVVTSATPPASKLEASETKVTVSPGGISTATMDGDDDACQTQEISCPVTSVRPEQITVTPSPAISTYSFHALPTLPKASSSAASANDAPSPAGSTRSNFTHGTPPELSASSSPPHIDTDNAHFFDENDEFDPNASGFSDHSIGLGTTAAANAACGDLSLVDLHDESAWGINEDGLMQLHQEIGGSIPGQKYFEDAEDAVALFTNGDDVFFGSS